MKYSIWYMKPKWFRHGILGKKPWSDLAKTHIHLKDLELPRIKGETVEHNLERIFYQMQGEMWSPNGEARELILSKGLQHTSMSVGDAIVANGQIWVVAMFGFETIGRWRDGDEAA
jgi:hypothetical protein